MLSQQMIARAWLRPFGLDPRSLLPRTQHQLVVRLVPVDSRAFSCTNKQLVAMQLGLAITGVKPALSGLQRAVVRPPTAPCAYPQAAVQRGTLR